MILFARLFLVILALIVPRVALAEPVLQHRMALTFAARADGMTIAQLIGKARARIG